MNINENPPVLNALPHLAQAGMPVRSTDPVELTCGNSHRAAHCQ
jgi:hypothetical protein